MPNAAGDEHILDNPVWHALRGPLARFAAPSAARSDLVRFDPEVSLFSATENIDERVWKEIGQKVGVEGACALFRDVIPTPPEGWEEQFRAAGLQMIAGRLSEPSGLKVAQLGSEDTEEMLALAELTEPGPFLPRTFELGRYIGIRRGGQLIAMAGERFRVPGFVEISAVCTHPDARGEGLAAELTLNVAEHIRRRGDEAFLHVLDTNENAIRLYEKLGFSTRRSVEVVFAQWHGTDRQA